MQLSQKRKIFAQFIFAFWKFRFNFENFQKKVTLIADVFRTKGLQKTGLINV